MRQSLMEALARGGGKLGGKLFYILSHDLGHLALIFVSRNYTKL